MVKESEINTPNIFQVSLNAPGQTHRSVTVPPLLPHPTPPSISFSCLGAKSSCNRIQPFLRRPEIRCYHGNEASLA